MMTTGGTGGGGGSAEDYVAQQHQQAAKRQRLAHASMLEDDMAAKVRWGSLREYRKSGGDL